MREDGATQDVAEATVLKLDSFVSGIRQTILDSIKPTRSTYPKYRPRSRRAAYYPSSSQTKQGA